MSALPGYGEKPPLQGYRRSFTAPPRQLSFHERAALDNSDAGSGLLYQHSAVRIISFEPPPESIVSRSSETHADADYPIDTIETLPWRSRGEALAAAGPMRIEKVQGSVHFLKCGHSFVHSILRNSQCWCVDGESKFVLRKGKLQYYRIELPGETAEDKVKVAELKSALATVLKFEKTPCPFKRAFSVDLPDDAITPRRKGKWKARESTLLSSPDPGTPTVRKWRSSRQSMPHTPPTSFPDAFNKRRPSDFSVPDSPSLPRPSPLQRRSSVAERRAAFENLQSSSRPPSRPQTPASSTSSVSRGEEDVSDRESSAAPEDLIQEDDSEQHQDEVSHKQEDADIEALETSQPPQDPDPKAEIVSSQTNSVRGPVLDMDSLVEETDIATQEHETHESAPIDEQEDSVLHHDVETDGEEPVSPVPRPTEEVPRPTEEVPEEPIDHVKEVEAELEALNLQPHQPSDHVLNDRFKPQHEVLGESQSIEDTPEPVLVDSQIETNEPADSSTESTAEEDKVIATEDEQNTSDVEESQLIPDDEDDTHSIASTADSFHTTDAAEDPPEPTLTAEAFRQLEAKQSPPSHNRNISELTVTASTFSSPSLSNDNELPPGTPRLIQSSMSDESWPDVQTPSLPTDQEGLRQRSSKTGQQRSLSPLPPSGNIVSSIPNHESTTQFTAAIIQKAATMAITKPVEVVVLVIHVLARIAGGATLNDLLNGGLFQRPQRAPRHHRNPSFPDRVVVRGSSSDEDEDEDDFGVPIRGRRGTSSRVEVKRPATIREEQQEGKLEGTQKEKREDDVDSLFGDDLD